MVFKWEESLKCATSCPRCSEKLNPDDKRVLSVYDHTPICMACKKAEENRPDYAEKAREMIGQCLAETELKWSDPEGFCYHHFYGYRCSGT